MPGSELQLSSRTWTITRTTFIVHRERLDTNDFNPTDSGKLELGYHESPLQLGNKKNDDLELPMTATERAKASRVSRKRLCGQTANTVIAVIALIFVIVVTIISLLYQQWSAENDFLQTCLAYQVRCERHM